MTACSCEDSYSYVCCTTIKQGDHESSANKHAYG